MKSQKIKKEYFENLLFILTLFFIIDTFINLSRFLGETFSLHNYTVFIIFIYLLIILGYIMFIIFNKYMKEITPYFLSDLFESNPKVLDNFIKDLTAQGKKTQNLNFKKKLEKKD